MSLDAHSISPINKTDRLLGVLWSFSSYSYQSRYWDQPLNCPPQRTVIAPAYLHMLEFNSVFCISSQKYTLLPPLWLFSSCPFIHSLNPSSVPISYQKPSLDTPHHTDLSLTWTSVSLDVIAKSFGTLFYCFPYLVWLSPNADLLKCNILVVMCRVSFLFRHQANPSLPPN